MKFAPCVVLAVAGAFSAAAQTPSATVVGRVTDPTGAVIPGVAIHVTNVDTNISQQGSSNEVGDFTILAADLVPEGPFRSMDYDVSTSQHLDIRRAYGYN